MRPLHLFRKEDFKAPPVKFPQALQRFRIWIYAFFILFLVFVSSVSCTNKQILKTEPILSLGPILEYEFSPNEQLVAVLLPTNALEPGNDNYLSVMQSSLIDGVSILIFDAETQKTLARSDVDSYTIENLRWSRLNNTLFYLDRGKDDVSIISWQIDTDEQQEFPFQHGGFDIAPNNLTMVAWGNLVRTQQSNVLTFYTWPQLEYVDTIILPDIEEIKDVQWGSSGSWLFINTSSGIYQFMLDSQTLTQIDSLFMIAPDLDPSDTLVAYQNPNGNIYSLSDKCIVKNFDISSRQLEWSLNPKVLYLVLLQLPERQNTLARLDLTNNRFSCLSK